MTISDDKRTKKISFSPAQVADLGPIKLVSATEQLLPVMLPCQQFSFRARERSSSSNTSAASTRCHNYVYFRCLTFEFGRFSLHTYANEPLALFLNKFDIAGSRTYGYRVTTACSSSRRANVIPPVGRCARDDVILATSRRLHSNCINIGMLLNRRDLTGYSSRK